MLGIPNTSPAAYPLNIVPFVANPSAGNRAVNESVMAKTDWTKMRGKQAFKFGYELMRFRDNEYAPGSPSGSFSYASVAGLSGSGTQTIPNTGQTGTNNGGSFAAFLLGSISSASASIPLISWMPRSTMHSLYVQDDWKIMPLFQIDSFGGFASAYPVLRADGTSPFQGNNYASRHVTWIDPNLRNPYTMTFNLGIQYELAAYYVLDVSYQGSAGVPMLNITLALLW